MEIVYRSFDGKIFDTEIKCMEYENDIRKKDLDNIIFLNICTDNDDNVSVGSWWYITSDAPIKTVLDKLDSTYAKLVYIPTFKARKALGSLADDYGLEGSEDELAVGWNYFNDDKGFMPFTNVDCLETHLADDNNYDTICMAADAVYEKVFNSKEH